MLKANPIFCIKVLFLMVTYYCWPFWINCGTGCTNGKSNVSPRITLKATQTPYFLLS